MVCESALSQSEDAINIYVLLALRAKGKMYNAVKVRRVFSKGSNPGTRRSRFSIRYSVTGANLIKEFYIGQTIDKGHQISCYIDRKDAINEEDCE